MTAYSLVRATRKSYTLSKKVSGTMSSVCVPKSYWHNISKVSHPVSVIGLDALSETDRSHVPSIDVMGYSSEHST